MTTDTQKQGTYAINPFSFSLLFNCWLDTSSAAGGGLTFKVRETVQSVNIYPNEFFPMYHSLSKPAQAILQYILCKVRWEQERLELRHERIEMTKTPFYNGINNLIDKGVLAKASRVNTYWVNPTFFFRGSRVKMYPEAIQFDKTSEIHTRIKESMVKAAVERREKD